MRSTESGTHRDTSCVNCNVNYGHSKINPPNPRYLFPHRVIREECGDLSYWGSINFTSLHPTILGQTPRGLVTQHPSRALLTPACSPSFST